MKNPLKYLKKAYAKYHRIVLTAACLAALAVIVIAADLYEKENALRIDYSFNGATTQSAVSEQVLRELDRDVHAYIILSAGSPNQTITSLFDRYCAISEHFTYSQESLARNPMLLTRFENISTEEYVNSDCIVLYCESTGRARVYHDEDFPVYEYSTESGYYTISGYNYDRPFAEGIVFVTQDEPITVKFLTGHKEMSGEDTAALEDLLTQKNYAVESVNLLNGDTLNDDDILLIICPQLDLTEAEYNSIIAFLQRGNGVFCITDYLDSTSLPYFDALLSEFGITRTRGMVISDAEMTDAYYADYPAYLMPRYSTTDLTEPLINSGEVRLIMPGSAALKILNSDQIDNEAFLISGSAYLRDYIRTAPDSAEKQEGDEEGYFALAAQSLRLWSNGNVSRCVVVGNSLMFTDSWLKANTDSDALLLRIMEYIYGSSPIHLDIPAKVSERQALDYASPVPLVLLALLPVAALAAAALIILIPRRRR